MAGTKMQLEDWLDDLCVRFIINLPQEDLSSVARICFQVEEAQWFYEDFIRPLDPTLPSMSLRSFCLRIFQHCPLLASFSVENHMKAFDQFMEYKTRIPVRGAILLNENMDSTVLVKGWKKGAHWSFPRGKINKDEDDLDCAIREVYEETGFDAREAGLVPESDEVKYIEISMREQQIRLYVFRDVPMDTHFQPRTRKEISKIQWYKLSELPAFRKKAIHQQVDAAAASNANKFYMVAPFLVPLKKWVVQQKKKDAARAASSSRYLASHIVLEEVLTEDDIATQSEPVVTPAPTAPALDTLEGATRELQRLLKVQPPTQGLQVSSSGEASSNKDKGEALLALLQARTEDRPNIPPVSSNNSNNPLPHTPLDHTIPQAPQPLTPHHHHPHQQLPFSSYQPPPTFPIPPNLNQNFAAPYYNQGRGLAQASHPFANHGNILPGVAPPRHPRRDNPVPLMHPQPLPPHVQQSNLTRGILPTPNMPDSLVQPGVPGGLKQQISNASQSSGSMPLPAHGLGLPPPQLNSHTMSLLNSFKSSGPEADALKTSSTAANGPSERENDAQNAAKPTRWSNMAPRTVHPAGEQPSFVSTGPPQAPHGTATNISSQTAINALFQRAPPTEKQRSALLDIFKKPDPLSPTSSEGTLRVGGLPGSKSSVSSQSTAKPSAKAIPDAGSTTVATETNGGPAQNNAALNLPYGAASILSRPRPTQDRRITDPFVSPQAVQTSSAPSYGNVAAQAAILGGKDSSQGHTHFPRGPNGAENMPPVPNVPVPQGSALPNNHDHFQYRGANNAPGWPVFSTPGMLQHRQEATSDQKQKLLSLFSKPVQPSPAAPAGDEKSKGKEPVALDQVQAQVQPGAQRSRVPSLASASAEGGPASGNQTPISPDERNFLLGYLESVTSHTSR